MFSSDSHVGEGRLASDSTGRTTGRDWTSPILLCVLGAIVYGWIALHSMESVGFSDSIDYLFMADFYRAWLHGGPISEVSSHYGTTRYPPLFPIALAVFGAGSDRQDLAGIVSCSLAVLAPLCVWLWLRRDDCGLRLAGWIALALLLYPAYFLLNLNVVSEPLAIALLALAFMFLVDSNLTTSRLLTASLLIGVALLARSALLPAIPALAIWLALRRDLTKPLKALATALASAPLALWLSYRSYLQSETYFDSLDPARAAALYGSWQDVLWLPPSRFAMAVVHN